MSVCCVMYLAHLSDVDRELHELRHYVEFFPNRNEIMGKFGASTSLSYPCLVVSYVTRKELGFVCVLPSRICIDMLPTISLGKNARKIAHKKSGPNA